MARRMLGWVVTLGVVLMAGCSVRVNSPVETTVRAQNDLYDLDVEVVGVISIRANTIDLRNVEIGDDVVFSLIEGGTISGERSTRNTGTVDVYIGQAVARGSGLSITFSDIDPMATTIERGRLNTLVFDETTAGVIFSALAKKKAS